MDTVPAVIATGAILCAAYNMVQPLVDPLLPKDAARHDALTRLLVIAIGAAVGIVQYLLLAQAVVGHDLAQAALSGCAEGLAAIAAYHLAGDNLPRPPTVNIPQLSLGSFSAGIVGAGVPVPHIAPTAAPAPVSAPVVTPPPTPPPSPVPAPPAIPVAPAEPAT